MLADVVAIIGKKAIIFQESSFRKKKISSVNLVKMRNISICIKFTEPLLCFQVHRT